MLTLDDAARLVMALPEVVEGERHGRRSWFVGGKAFAWVRPFTKADLKRFGDATPPDGPIVAITTADLAEKAAILAAHPDGLFTISHFDNYPAVLADLSRISRAVLQEVLLDGWLACAPPALAEKHRPS